MALRLPEAHRSVCYRLSLTLDARIEHCEALGNSSFSENLKVVLDDGRTLFVKCQPQERFDILQAEADGLRWLAEAQSGLNIPTALALDAGERGALPTDPAFMAIPYLPPGPRSAEQEIALGRGLAHLHRAPCPGIGLAKDNFLANVPQDNHATSDWPTFYIERRLRPLVERLHAAGQLPARTCDELRRRFPLITERIATGEPPSRLHGDLWGGNALFTTQGPALIDPAVYGGQREIDLAMMDLFGGFSPRCLAAYEATYPLEPGASQRRPLYQLYPLLIHVLLFGGHYATQVQTIVCQTLR